MKSTVTIGWKQLNKFPWEALFRCAQEYKDRNPSHNDRYYREYLQDTWGIDHGYEHVKIVDEQKYMMFLLRFA